MQILYFKIMNIFKSEVQIILNFDNKIIIIIIAFN